MKKLLTLSLCFLVLFCLAITAHGQYGTKKSMIPHNWTVFYEATGDLNKDSIDDVAMIIENPVPNEDGEKARALLILLKNDKVADSYYNACQADHVIMGSGEGGTLGDPFSEMEIKKNVLRIEFFGGSREKWTTTHRYRFQNQSFAVIGATYKTESDEGTEIYDYNVSNGKLIVTKKNYPDKAKNGVTNLVRKIKPPDLKSFTPDAIWAIILPDYYFKKVATCVLQEVKNSDCVHVIFDCGDFGNSEVYLDEASETLFYDLISEREPGDMYVNPKYKGKTFEITYVEQTRVVECQPDVKSPYQLIVGFKLKN